MRRSRGDVFLLWVLLAAGASAGEGDYVGARACAACHPAQAAELKTDMGVALEPAASCGILKDHARLSYRLGPYTYEILRQGDRSIYTVEGPGGKIQVPLEWAFGRGHAGQTYVFERDGAFYESRVSYYRDIDGLDVTLGAPHTTPGSLEEAAGRRMDQAAARDCFRCHSTGGVVAGQLAVDKLTPGVTCEACHGPGSRHVASIRNGKPAPGSIVNPKTLSTEEISDFCGTCHRSWAEIMTSGIRGVSTVRFQPYRLTNSRCYDAADRRISCVACHDPHRHLETTPASYDARCRACHTPGAAAKIHMCPVSKKDCVTCHMPKYELPGGHYRFTDHQIRVARPGQAFPM